MSIDDSSPLSLACIFFGDFKKKFSNEISSNIQGLHSTEIFLIWAFSKLFRDYAKVRLISFLETSST